MGSTNHQDTHKRFFSVFIFIIFIIILSIIFISFGIAVANDNQLLSLVSILVGFLIVLIGGIYGRFYNQDTLMKMKIIDNSFTFIQYKAGYYSFVGSMYIIVFMMIVYEFIIQSKIVFYIGLGLNFVIFIILYNLMKRQERSKNI